jgi:hypothetical protein
MKNVLVLAAILVFVVFFAARPDDHVVPHESELEPVTGVVVSVTRTTSRHGPDGRVVVSLEQPGLKRELISYDESLATLLPAGTTLEGKVFGGSGDSELWSLSASNGVTRTYEDTVSFRATDLEDRKRSSWIFDLIVVAAVIIGAYMPRFGK